MLSVDVRYFAMSLVYLKMRVLSVNSEKEKEIGVSSVRLILDVGCQSIFSFNELL